MIQQLTKQESKKQGLNINIQPPSEPFKHKNTVEPKITLNQSSPSIEYNKSNKAHSIKIKGSLSEPLTIKIEAEKGIVNLNLEISIEKNSQASIIIKRFCKSVSYNENLGISVQDSSQINLTTINDFDNESIVNQIKTTTLKKDSSIKQTDLIYNGKYFKEFLVNKLSGKGANSKTFIIYLAKDEQQYDIYTASIHEGKNTTSNMITKGAVNDKARALSHGLVRIEENASGSNGYETQDALLLSDYAEADAIPNLEIKNNDVKCSHGSTVGQIDKDKIFYLMSRGLSEKQAKQKIIEGYFSQVILELNDEEISDKIYSHISEFVK